MKYLNKIIVLLVFTFAFISCDENENFGILPAQESFQIVTPSSGTVIVLNDTNLDNNALFISWKTLSGTTGTFDIEVAETGTDFEAPYLLGSTDAKNFSMTVGEINDFLLDVMGLDPEKAISLDVRILNNGEITQTISVVLTPYKVEYTELFVVGNITDPQWSPADALAMKNVGFNEFEITLDLAEGAEFKFLPTNIDYEGDFGKDPDNDGMLIQEGEVNLSGYAAGKYDVYVNLNTFTYTLTQITAPENLYVVGSLTNWSPEEALQMNKISDGVFALVINLQDGDAFKFIPTNTSWDGAWKEDPNNPGTITDEAGDPNISGYAAGKYVAMVDFNTLTFKLSSVDNLYIVGSLTAWDPASAIQMSEASLGVFSKVVDLADGDACKFIPTNTSWDGAWKEDPNNPGIITDEAGDPNISGYAGGKYVITVNFNTLSFSVSAVTAIPTNLYLVGSLTSWDPAQALQFNNTSNGVFTLVINLTEGDAFKFIPTNTSWDGAWKEAPAYPGTITDEAGDPNISGYMTGTYLITVDFNNGNFSVVLQ